MTYCCENIKEAYELIGRAQDKLNWRPEGFSFGDYVAGVLTLNTSSGVKVSNYLKRAIDEMIDAFRLLNQARTAINLCSCGIERDFYKNRESELVNKYNNLSSNSTDKYNGLVDEWNELKEKYNDLVKNSVSKESAERLESEYKKNVKDYNELVAEHRELAEKCRNLIERLEEYGEYKDMYENIRSERESERVNNTREITTLRRDNMALQGRLTDTQQRLTASENKLARIEDRFEAKGREVLELKSKLERLSINVDNLEKSREELLNEKVNLKNEKLEVFANNLGINLDEVDNLLRYYERLIHARKNYNQTNIATHEGNINRVKGMLRQNGVSVENTNKCCRKCEKVAKLRIELNEIRQQQYEARQEVPPR